MKTKQLKGITMSVTAVSTQQGVSIPVSAMAANLGRYVHDEQGKRTTQSVTATDALQEAIASVSAIQTNQWHVAFTTLWLLLSLALCFVPLALFFVPPTCSIFVQCYKEKGDNPWTTMPVRGYTTYHTFVR